MNVVHTIAWRGSIEPDEDAPEKLPVLKDVVFTPRGQSQDFLPSNLQIRSVALVPTSAVPLHLIGSQQFRLYSGCSETKQWLVEQFIQDELVPVDHDQHPCLNEEFPSFWWLQHGAKSPRALLLHTYCGIPDDQSPEGSLLVYAATGSDQRRPLGLELDRRPPTIEFLVLELLLESNLKLASLDRDVRDQPAALQPQGAPVLEHELTSQDVDNPHAHPPVSHNRIGFPRSTTTVSEPSLPDIRPNKRLQSLEHSRRSSLSRVLSVNEESPRPGSPSVSAIEEQNRAAIQRLIMIGMRMYGFSHRNRRQDSVSTSQSIIAKSGTPTFDVNSKLRDFDDEYKQIYHQTFRGVCLALRNHIAVKALPADVLQRVIDSLLAVFCTNPLEESNEMVFDSGAEPVRGLVVE